MKGRTLLTIDDDEIFCSIIQDAAKEFEMTSISSHQGATGLEIIRGTKVDVVLVDINLPDTNGINIIKDIRRLTSIPIIATSGDENAEIIGECIKMGCFQFMKKPFRLSEFKIAIMVALQRSKEMRTLNAAINKAKPINMAIGILMCKERKNKHDAEQALKMRARSRRISMKDISEEIIREMEVINHRRIMG